MGDFTQKVAPKIELSLRPGETVMAAARANLPWGMLPVFLAGVFGLVVYWAGSSGVDGLYLLAGVVLVASGVASMASRRRLSRVAEGMSLRPSPAMVLAVTDQRRLVVVSGLGYKFLGELDPSAPVSLRHDGATSLDCAGGRLTLTGVGGNHMSLKVPCYSEGERLVEEVMSLQDGTAPGERSSGLAT